MLNSVDKFVRNNHLAVAVEMQLFVQDVILLHKEEEENLLDEAYDLDFEEYCFNEGMRDEEEKQLFDNDIIYYGYYLCADDFGFDDYCFEPEYLSSAHH